MQNTNMPIVVIGAGMIGVSTALHLQRMGEEVILLDREAPAAGASHGNGGILACSAVVPVMTPGAMGRAPGMLLDKDGPLFLRWGYMPFMLPFMMKYLASSKAEVVERIAKGLQPLLADGLNQHLILAEGTKARDALNSSTYIYLYKDRAGYEGDSFGWNLRRENGYDWDLAEGGEVKELEPAVNEDYQFAVLLRDHGYIEAPGQYVKDLVSSFEENGGTFKVGSVVDFEATDNGVNVVLQGGEKIAARKTVVATGVWSNDLARKVGVTVPMETERGYHIELDNPSIVPNHPLMDASRKFVVAPMGGNSMRFAGVVEFGGLEAAPSKGPIELLKRGAQNLFPGLTYDTRREWMGHRPAPADSLPVLGMAPNNNNIILAYGHHHIGLTAGPKTGLLAAQLAAGRTPDVELSAYAPDRKI